MNGKDGDIRTGGGRQVATGGTEAAGGVGAYSPTTVYSNPRG